MAQKYRATKEINPEKFQRLMAITLEEDQELLKQLAKV